MKDDGSLKPLRRPISAYLRRPLRSWQEALRDRALREAADKPARNDPEALKSADR